VIKHLDALNVPNPTRGRWWTLKQKNGVKPDNDRPDDPACHSDLP
jgi:hypothetical protein